MSIPAAWYPDPDNASLLRWWDGTAWTEHRHPLPASAMQGDASKAQHPATSAPDLLVTSTPSETPTSHSVESLTPMTPATSAVGNLLLSLLSVLLLITSAFMLYVFHHSDSLASSYIDDLEQLHATELQMSKEIAGLKDEIQRLEDIANGM
ncbi:DUF2510 domain-containing protein [Schaalia canis]|uniref:DUF2510 domain-containing protein n=1 Tax=Schaalia canis TaxID=100469 RepID=A0A3P1SF03_9ACTO|nr:DUF2510 domain-containing protein [Schaalia canis]RRC95345.1 DUF2510 domain-containing protein [Schaalia canis]